MSVFPDRGQVGTSGVEIIDYPLVRDRVFSEVQPPRSAIQVERKAHSKCSTSSALLGDMG